MGAQVLKAFLKYPWLTRGMVQTALAGCAADVFAQYSQGHRGGVLLSTCLLLCKRMDYLGRVCSTVSLVLPECKSQGFINVVHWGTSSIYYLLSTVHISSIIYDVNINSGDVCKRNKNREGGLEGE